MDMPSELLTTRAVNYQQITEAGAPGSVPRVVVTAALLTRASVYASHLHARGPHAYDWLGLVRQVMSEACEALGREGGLDDTLDYDYERPLGIGTLARLFESWGLEEVPLGPVWPGDVVIMTRTKTYGGEDTHCGVITRGGADPLIYHTHPGHPPAETGYMKVWEPRALRLFRLPG